MRKFIFSILIFSSFISLGQAPEKFEFVFSLRTGEIPNMYISSENLYIKDMVVDPPLQVRVKLTKKEREEILNKVQEIKFFDYPEKYNYQKADTSHLIGESIPCSHYELTVFPGKKYKQTSWSDCITSEKSKNNQFENLQELKNLIWKILYSKKSLKKSKVPRAMYL